MKKPQIVYIPNVSAPFEKEQQTGEGDAQNEWTVEAAKEIVAMPMINEYLVNDVAEIIQRYGNAALAAEREKRARVHDDLEFAQEQLADTEKQLADEREKIKPLVELAEGNIIGCGTCATIVAVAKEGEAK
jgi:hypothetical protein